MPLHHTMPEPAQPSSPIPDDHGLMAWTYDPSFASTAQSPVIGTVYLMAVYLRKPMTITRCWFMTGTAATTPTASQNWIGLYNSSGTLLSSGNADSAVTIANTPRSVNLAAAQTVGAGMYWVGMVFNAATNAQVLRGNGAFSGTNNVNLGNAQLRYAVNGASQTTLANITPSSNTATGAFSFWTAVN